MRTKMDVQTLIDTVCDDGSDFNDWRMGYASGRWDADSQTLTLSFERDSDAEVMDGDSDFESTTRRFALIAEEGDEL